MVVTALILFLTLSRYSVISEMLSGYRAVEDLADESFILDSCASSLEALLNLSGKSVLIAQAVSMVTGVNHYKTFLNIGDGYRIVKVFLSKNLF